MKQEFKVEVPEGYEIDEGNSTFERIVFKKKDERPMSWSSFMATKSLTKSYMTAAEYREGFYNVWRYHQDKYTALRKLELLCKAWGGGYGKDFAIATKIDGFMVWKTSANIFLLSFNNEKDARLFLEIFKDLLEEAKELL